MRGERIGSEAGRGNSHITTVHIYSIFIKIFLKGYTGGMGVGFLGAYQLKIFS